MADNNHDEPRLPKECPFWKETCHGKKCELWGKLGMVVPSQIAGIPNQVTYEGCTFVLGVMASAARVSPPPVRR